MTEMQVDINADAGESYGAWPMGRDHELFPFLSSVNLACGFHAGDPLTMQRTVALAREHGVAVGAHPGYPDRVGFGRRDLAAGADELYADTLYQIGALQAFVQTGGLRLSHVKPHGALYLRMLRDEVTARAVAEAVKAYDPGLPFFVLSGSLMERVARELGLPVVLEVFPDRAYLSDGRLAGRDLAGSVIRDPAEAARRAVMMVTQGRVQALDGGWVELQAETLCIHGDNPEAPDIARTVRQALEAEGVRVRAHSQR
ncbi:LamB/YcsF family protein [Deinococcus peraridilitoris]|uniref:5-oxoprolinase subunit A n=1 Tax=Deinococcus peraridilitoris (strain DSM 19664 / LMG 22246 / CIP 109416 / KR-200) TaxID=937777 RepID=L0A0G9_DEIPD|nr:5-oxoprolinase subunit PxpA [Deinococcus peraridilitoris]AFZ67341.1 putative lactam utilization protein B-like protein [Deinococcus peraridilitoris DSM 19664]